MRMPLDVIEDLKKVAPLKGMSGYQALIKFYVGQGLRQDLELLWHKNREERPEAALDELRSLSALMKSVLQKLEEDLDTRRAGGEL
ncbi:MAG: hypothetical protein AB1664_03005 [Thermodesulfobacteriota bacterium]